MWRALSDRATGRVCHTLLRGAACAVCAVCQVTELLAKHMHLPPAPACPAQPVNKSRKK